MHTVSELRDYWDLTVCQELRRIGIVVTSIWDLRQLDREIPKAAPLLASMLPSIGSNDVKGVVCDVLIKWKADSEICNILIREFREARGFGADLLKWEIGNKLAQAATEAVHEDIGRLWLDRSHGYARQMLAQALVKCRHPRAAELLAQCLNDPSVDGHAVEALGMLKATEMCERIVPFLEHEKAWIRKAAKRALARMGKAARKKGPAIRDLLEPIDIADREPEPALRKSHVRRYAESLGLREFERELSSPEALRRFLSKAGGRSGGDLNGKTIKALIEAIGDQIDWHVLVESRAGRRTGKGYPPLLHQRSRCD